MSIESLLGAVGVLAIVIFVHELGHFLVAKWCDVEVLTFSMGFGPTVFSRKIGETEYRLALLPLGGYVRMAGEEDWRTAEDGSDPARGFAAKSIPRRAAIVGAGPAVNLIFAFVLFASVYAFYGDRVPTEQARVGSVMLDLPAAAAGLLPGDRVVSVDGRAIAGWDEFAEVVRDSEGRALSLEIERADGATTTVTIQPELSEQKDMFGEVVGEFYMIGVQRGVDSEAVGPIAALRLGAQATYRWSALIFETLARLVGGSVDAKELGGPIMIAREAGRLAATGLEPLLRFMAVISVNLGIINILPIPILDGGHLLFFAYEAVRGKPLSQRIRELALQAGALLLAALMVFVVYNDLSRIFFG
jgi:regulator of sigma E protease